MGMKVTTQFSSIAGHRPASALLMNKKTATAAAINRAPH
jgi:hypothetical protein